MVNFTISINGSECELSNIKLGKDEEFLKLPRYDTITRLIIKNSKIPCLTEDILGSFPNIEYFWGSEIGIKEVSEDAFVRCQHLKRIILNRNKIKKLKMKTFNQNPSLTILDLNYNHLTYLPNELFWNLKELYELSLSCNQLTSLSKKLFRDLESLRVFSVRNNELLDLKVENMIEQAPKLKWLSLIDNDFTEQRMREILALCEKVKISCTKNRLARNRSCPYNPVMVEGFPCVPDAEHARLVAKQKIAKLEQKVKAMQKKNDFMQSILETVQKKYDFMENKLAILMKDHELQQKTETKEFFVV